MAHRLFAAAITLTTLSLVPAAVIAQGRNAARTPWGDPDLSGLWTNATLTVLQRPPELAGKEFFTAEEAAKFEKTRIEQTNADRPVRAGDVGAYNDVYFERGKGMKSRRTSLVIEPRDGRIPPFMPDAQLKVDARQREEAARPADGPESRWLTERCILFGATVPMLPEPYNNNYSIFQRSSLGVGRSSSRWTGPGGRCSKWPATKATTAWAISSRDIGQRSGPTTKLREGGRAERAPGDMTRCVRQR